MTASRLPIHPSFLLKGIWKISTTPKETTTKTAITTTVLGTKHVVKQCERVLFANEHDVVCPLTVKFEQQMEERQLMC